MNKSMLIPESELNSVVGGLFGWEQVVAVVALVSAEIDSFIDGAQKGYNAATKG